MKIITLIFLLGTSLFGFTEKEKLYIKLISHSIDVSERELLYGKYRPYLERCDQNQFNLLMTTKSKNEFVSMIEFFNININEKIDKKGSESFFEDYKYFILLIAICLILLVIAIYLIAKEFDFIEFDSLKKKDKSNF